MKKLQKKKQEVNRGSLASYKERSCLFNTKVQGEAGSPACINRTAISYTENLTKIINEGGYPKQSIFSVDRSVILIARRGKVSDWLQIFKEIYWLSC